MSLARAGRARACYATLVESRRPVIAGSENYQELRDQAVVLTGAQEGLQQDAVSLAGEPRSLRESYGDTRFGRAMLLARRLSEAGVPLTAIHFNEASRMRTVGTFIPRTSQLLQEELLPMLVQSLAALYSQT